MESSDLMIFSLVSSWFFLKSFTKSLPKIFLVSWLDNPSKFFTIFSSIKDISFSFFVSSCIFFLVCLLYSKYATDILIMQPNISMTNRKANFSYPRGFSFNSGLHCWFLLYLLLISKSRFAVASNLIISLEKKSCKMGSFFHYDRGRR